jgi:hypothetical protein
MDLPKRAKDLTGQRYGSLLAVRPTRLSDQGSMVWEWRCDCGTLCEGTGTQIKAVAKAAVNPKVPSCGCVKAERARETNTTHGYSRHPLFAIWQAMKQRCHNPNHKEYPRYGAKGVTICQEWLDNPESFVKWALDQGWRKGMHIDKDMRSDALGTTREYSPVTCQIVSGAVNVGYSGSRQNHQHNRRIKLKPDDIVTIKALYATGEHTQAAIAHLYGVSKAAIQRAITT